MTQLAFATTAYWHVLPTAGSGTPNRLQKKIATKRNSLLHSFINPNYVFQELELWVSEAVKRMDETDAPETVSDAEALLELHHEKKVRDYFIKPSTKHSLHETKNLVFL